MELVRRKNANGRYYEDEGNLLNLKRRPAPREIDTSGLDVDVFIDDDEDVKPEVKAEAKLSDCAGYHGNLDLNINDDDDEKPKKKTIRSSKFIPDFDW